MNAVELFHQRAIAGARRYAAADRSDPFAFARALTHIRVGIVQPFREEGQDHKTPSGAVMYDATPFTEMREVELTSGKTMVPYTVYRNITRP